MEKPKNCNTRGLYCAVAECTSMSGTGYTMHTFPSDQKIRRQWIKFVATCRSNFGPTFGTPTRYSAICHLHFEENCYPQSFWLKTSFGINTCRKLKPDAVPTIQKPRTAGICSISVLPSVKKVRGASLKRERHRETSSSGRKRCSKKILADTTEGDAVCHELLDVKKEAPDQEDRKLPEKLLFSKRPFHVETDNMCDQQRECVCSQRPEQLLFAVKKEPVDPEDQIKSPGVNIASSVSLSDSSCMCSQHFKKSTQNSQELCAVKQEVLDQDQITSGEPLVPSESFHDSSCMCSKHFKKSTQNSQELFAVKQEVLDQDQVTSGEPLVPSESFHDINPILESKAASISTFYGTQGQKYEYKSTLVSSEENFTIELNPEWLLENGNSENVSY